jgi:hypothetical protein
MLKKKELSAEKRESFQFVVAIIDYVYQQIYQYSEKQWALEWERDIMCVAIATVLKDVKQKIFCEQPIWSNSFVEKYKDHIKTGSYDDCCSGILIEYALILDRVAIGYFSRIARDTTERWTAYRQRLEGNDASDWEATKSFKLHFCTPDELELVFWTNLWDANSKLRYYPQKIVKYQDKSQKKSKKKPKKEPK